ncbi:hypothetical protein DFH09DRAFT_1101901 [Mycena vulgaris]|nr:hypothetical protein DFH09DRAFT_1101901 [Mycena vulgaris]
MGTRQGRLRKRWIRLLSSWALSNQAAFWATEHPVSGMGGCSATRKRFRVKRYKQLSGRLSSFLGNWAPGKRNGRIFGYKEEVQAIQAAFWATEHRVSGVGDGRQMWKTNSTMLKATLSLLTSAEELRYKLDIAHDILNSREAEANVVQSLLVEAHAAVDRRQAEIKLATLLEIEAKRRLQYYSRMNEIASKNLTDAEMQVGSLQIEHRELGGPEEHNRAHRIKEEITDSDGVDFLLTLD